MLFHHWILPFLLVIILVITISHSPFFHIPKSQQSNHQAISKSKTNLTFFTSKICSPHTWQNAIIFFKNSLQIVSIPPDSRQKRKLSCILSNCCVLSFNNQIPAMTVFLRFFIVCYESFCFPLCFYAFFFTRFLQLVFLQPFACMSCNLADTSVFYRRGESYTCYQPEECICSATLYKHFIFFPRLFPVFFNLKPEL